MGCQKLYISHLSYLCRAFFTYKGRMQVCEELVWGPVNKSLCYHGIMACSKHYSSCPRTKRHKPSTGTFLTAKLDIYFSKVLFPLTWTYLKVKVEITYIFPNFNRATVEVWEWISNFTRHFITDVITYPCWDQSYVIKRGLRCRWLYLFLKYH